MPKNLARLYNIGGGGGEDRLAAPITYHINLHQRQGTSGCDNARGARARPTMTIGKVDMLL